jgi:hypothetical protein
LYFSTLDKPKMNVFCEGGDENLTPPLFFD